MYKSLRLTKSYYNESLFQTRLSIIMLPGARCRKETATNIISSEYFQAIWGHNTVFHIKKNNVEARLKQDDEYS